MTDQTIKLINMIISSVTMYYNLFYNFQTDLVSKLYTNRDVVLRQIQRLEGVPNDEVIIINKLEAVLEIFVDLTEAKMSLSLDERKQENVILQ